MRGEWGCVWCSFARGLTCWCGCARGVGVAAENVWVRSVRCEMYESLLRCSAEWKCARRLFSGGSKSHAAREPYPRNRESHSLASPSPPQLPMPPTQRYPQGINPYAPPHTAKPQSKSHAANPPKKQHPPPPHHHLPPPDKHVADSAKVEDFAPPAWRTVLHNRIDFGMYSLCTLGGSSSCSGDRLPRLLSLQTRVRAAGGCAHRGKRQERLRSQAVCLRGGQYSMPDMQAERSCVDRPRHSQCMDLYTSICLEGVSICSCSWARSLSRSRRGPCHSSSMLHAYPPRTY